MSSMVTVRIRTVTLADAPGVNEASMYQESLVTGHVSDRRSPDCLFHTGSIKERPTLMILVPIVSAVGGEGSAE